MLDHSESLLSIMSDPDLTFQVKERCPLGCFRNSYCYSEIHIPTILLTNRQKSSNTWESRGIFHTLKKRGQEQQLESFTVYSDTDSEAEVFESDSDDDFSFDCISNEIMKTKDDTQKTTEKTENSCELKLNPAKSISLTEILHIAKEVDITNFEFKEQYKHSDKGVETWQPSTKRKNFTKKKKAVNSVTLGKFLEGYTEEDKQEAYANDYLRKILNSNSKTGDEDEIQLKNNNQFPNLIPKRIEFMHGEKLVAKPPKNTAPVIAETLSQADKHEEINTFAETPALGTNVGKIAIENIPSEIPTEDIELFFKSYGELEKFNLEQHGNFFKAFVEINLSDDIDWIIECLNGTQPFGASSRLLKCYKLD